MLDVVILVPLGGVDTIDIRPLNPDAVTTPCVSVSMAVDAGQFVDAAANKLAATYFEPAVAALQSILRQRGFGTSHEAADIPMDAQPVEPVRRG
jgi:hypothetical protein